MKTACGAPPPSCGLASAALGDGVTAEEAIADLRKALIALIEEVGVPQELTLTRDVA